VPDGLRRELLPGDDGGGKAHIVVARAAQRLQHGLFAIRRIIVMEEEEGDGPGRTRALIFARTQDCPEAERLGEAGQFIALSSAAGGNERGTILQHPCGMRPVGGGMRSFTGSWSGWLVRG